MKNRNQVGQPYFKAGSTFREEVVCVTMERQGGDMGTQLAAFAAATQTADGVAISNVNGAAFDTSVDLKRDGFVEFLDAAGASLGSYRITKALNVAGVYQSEIGERFYPYAEDVVSLLAQQAYSAAGANPMHIWPDGSPILFNDPDTELIGVEVDMKHPDTEAEVFNLDANQFLTYPIKAADGKYYANGWSDLNQGGGRQDANQTAHVIEIASTYKGHSLTECSGSILKYCYKRKIEVPATTESCAAKTGIGATDDAFALLVGDTLGITPTDNDDQGQLGIATTHFFDGTDFVTTGTINVLQGATVVGQFDVDALSFLGQAEGTGTLRYYNKDVAGAISPEAVITFVVTAPAVVPPYGAGDPATAGYTAAGFADTLDARYLDTITGNVYNVSNENFVFTFASTASNSDPALYNSTETAAPATTTTVTLTGDLSSTVNIALWSAGKSPIWYGLLPVVSAVYDGTNTVITFAAIAAAPEYIRPYDV